MKRQIYLAILVVLPSVLAAQESAINFETGTFEEAFVKAKEAGKYLFIDCFATWCVPCKELEKEVFTDKTVAEYFNSKFINLRLDVEKGEGPELRKRFGVQPVPTLLFINSEGKVEHKFIGSSSPGEFLKKTQELFTNENRYGVLERKYAEGARDLTFMTVYLNELLNQTEYSKARELLAAVIAENPAEDICTVSFWPIITHNWIAEFNSVYYNLLIDNRDTFIRNVSKETYDRTMSSLFRRYAGTWIFSGARKGTESDDIVRAGADVIKLSLDDKAEILLLLEIAGSRVQKDYDKFISLIEDNYNVITEEEKFKLFINSDFFSKEATPSQCSKYLSIIERFVNESGNETYKTRLARVISGLQTTSSKSN